MCSTKDPRLTLAYFTHKDIFDCKFNAFGSLTVEAKVIILSNYI